MSLCKTIFSCTFRTTYDEYPSSTFAFSVQVVPERHGHRAAPRVELHRQLVDRAPRCFGHVRAAIVQQDVAPVCGGQIGRGRHARQQLLVEEAR